MVKLFVIALCVAGLLTSNATAGETYSGPTATGQERGVALARSATREMDREAIREGIMCKVDGSCGTLTDEDRAKAALALLFLRISENCNRQPCALRLVKSR